MRSTKHAQFGVGCSSPLRINDYSPLDMFVCLIFFLIKSFNNRYANYYKVNDTETRTLYKAYGILFQVIVTGEAGKFDIIPLLTNIGAGLALLSLVSTIPSCLVFPLKCLGLGQFHYFL